MHSKGTEQSAIRPDGGSAEPIVQPPDVQINEVISDRPGRWVTLPTGERVFLLGKPAESRAALSDAAQSLSLNQPPQPSSPVSQPREFEARSQEIEEVINYKAGWGLRWGMASILAAILSLLITAQFVRYPEVVRGTATVTTPTPPIRLVRRLGGEVERILVKDGESVEAGAAVAVFKSGSNSLEILNLERDLRTAMTSLERDDGKIEWPGREAQGLGQLQLAYSSFEQAISEYLAFQESTYYAGIVKAINTQASSEQLLRESLERRLSLLEQEVGLMDSQRSRNAELARTGLVSREDVDRANAEHLQRRQAFEAARAEQAASEIRIAQTMGALLEAQQRRESDERSLRGEVRSRAHALSAAIEAWRLDYLIIAPIGGRIAFFRPLAEGQFVAPLEPLLAVAPDGSEAVASVLLNPTGFGRVRVGQRVILRLDSFPDTEFGTVTGQVQSVSLLMNESKGEGPGGTYLVRVTLPVGLKTSYGRLLELRQEMSGVADIITEDRSLLERLLDQVRGLSNSSSAQRPNK